MQLTKKKDDLLYWGLSGLILYMPLHYYLCELLLNGTGLDNILRDLLILAMLALVVLTKGLKWELLSVTVGISCLTLTVMGVASTVLNRSFRVLNILRTYLVPLLIFYVCADVKLDVHRFKRLNQFLVVGLTVVGVYGFVQAFFLKDDFLIMLGYPNDGEHLSSNSFYIAHFFGEQRSAGTFVSPNICGIILAMAAIALLYTDPMIAYKTKYIFTTLLVVGLLATFSRSSMLGLAVAGLFAMGISCFWKRLSKKTFPRAVAVVLTVAVLVALDWLLLDGMFLKMLLSTVFRTFNGEDPSANAHKDHLISPPGTSTESPVSWDFLMTFGLNGPMAEEFVANPRKVESSFYLMEFEMGVLGAVLYYLPYVAVIVKTLLDRKRYPYFVPAAVSLAVLASYVFLPNVQTFEVPFYCFLFMGLYANSSVREIYQSAGQAQ